MRAYVYPYAPNKVVFEALRYYVRDTAPGRGEIGAGRAAGAAAGRGERGGGCRRGVPAMIASCLCYLLLPAARLFRALSGTGPAC